MSDRKLGVFNQIPGKSAFLTLAARVLKQREQVLKANPLRGIFIPLFVAGLSLSLMFSACSSSPSSNTNLAQAARQSDLTINLVSFSVTQAAHEKIIPKFVGKWKQEHNSDGSI